MGRQAIDGESPVGDIVKHGSGILSRGGPEKSPLNLAAPSAKATYS